MTASLIKLGNDELPFDVGDVRDFLEQYGRVEVFVSENVEACRLYLEDERVSGDFDLSVYRSKHVDYGDGPWVVCFSQNRDVLEALANALKRKT